MVAYYYANYLILLNLLFQTHYVYVLHHLILLFLILNEYDYLIDILLSHLMLL